MVKDYLEKLKSIWLQPSDFYEKSIARLDEKDSGRFILLTGVLVSLELGLAEAVQGGTIWIVLMVTVLLMIGLPFLFTAWVFVWSGFMRLCAYLLGESLPLEPVRKVTAYSTAGFAAMILGFGFGKWVALATFVFQLVGVEKVLKCSRWTAAVYVGLPFSMIGVLFVIFIFMFQVFK